MAHGGAYDLPCPPASLRGGSPIVDRRAAVSDDRLQPEDGVLTMSEIKTIADLTPDDRNANAGTERGQYMVAHSLEQYGAGRSILVDKAGRVIAGNKTLEAAAAMGLDVRVVPSDGRALVVVQRTDLDLDSPEGRALAVADNRASEVGLSWDAVVLGGLSTEVDLSGLFHPDELSAILEQAGTQLIDVDFKEYDESVENDVKYCTCPQCGHKFPA